MCPECGHEWNPDEINMTVADETESSVVKDANGNVLQDGDTVILIKDLPVKGASKSIKAGTKVKNIKLTTGDHNIDCKVEGFGAMGLKSIYVKKGQPTDMKALLITPEGLEKLKAELDHLWRVERPDTTQKVAWAASLGDRSENADYHTIKNACEKLTVEYCICAKIN